MVYLIAAGIALSVALLVIGVANLGLARNRPSKNRLIELGLKGPFTKDEANKRNRVRERLTDLFSAIGTPMESPKRDWSQTRERLIHAGYREPSALPIYLGTRIGLAALLYVYGGFAAAALDAPGRLGFVLALVFGGLGWVLPSFVLSTRIAKRQKELQRALPDAVDLLVICVEAGLGLNQAFQRVAAEMRHLSELFTLEIAQMNMEVRAGAPRDQAMMALAERTGVPDIRSLVTMLIQTERFGTSIAESLRIHSDTMRTKRQQRAEEAAAKTTIKIVFPLAICIFPALFVVVLGPAVIEIFQTFGQLGG